MFDSYIKVYAGDIVDPDRGYLVIERDRQATFIFDDSTTEKQQLLALLTDVDLLGCHQRWRDAGFHAAINTRDSDTGLGIVLYYYLPCYWAADDVVRDYFVKKLADPYVIDLSEVKNNKQ